VIGLCAIGSPFAVALRGGASLSMLGIGVQGKGGTRTGRFRCLARCLLTWLPGVVFGITRAFGGDSEAYGGVFALAIYSAAIGWAIPKPDRGPADLLAGTRHVAR
jgi:hypothetical protein